MRYLLMCCVLITFAPGCVQRAVPDKPQPSPVVPAPDVKPVEREYWEAVADTVQAGAVRDTDELTRLVRSMAEQQLVTDAETKLKTLGLPGPKLVPLDTDAVRVEWAGKVRGVAR